MRVAGSGSGSGSKAIDDRGDGSGSRTVFRQGEFSGFLGVVAGSEAWEWLERCFGKVSSLAFSDSFGS
nr:hypothetical protein CFP56_75943 [Quercus suber]